MNSYEQFRKELTEAVLCGDGVTGRSLRQAIETAAASVRDEHSLSDRPISPALQRYLRKVSRHAYKVTDADVMALKQEGWSEDAIFELTVCTAVGAGLGRLERGLALLDSAEAKQREAHHEIG